MPSPRGRALAGVFAAVALLAAAWHASPLLLWHLRLEAQLVAETDAELRAARRTPLPPPAGWATLRLANLAVRLPLSEEGRERCAQCEQRCVLPLDDGGTFAVFDAIPRETLGETRDSLAPDPVDLSLLRSVARNWRTIDALTDRARVAAPPPGYRFETPASAGVAAAFRADGTRRYALLAYGPGGTPTRALGVTGVSEQRFDRILGGLEVSALPAEERATCR